MGSKAVRFKDNNGNAVYPCPYYPVGSIYLSVTNTNPATFFGGKWEQIKDTFLLACGNTYKNGATGGEATHKLTVNEMPSHNHKISRTGLVLAGGSGYTETTDPYHPNEVYPTYTYNTGGDQPHNNMPPYLAVYVWKRTA